MNDLVEKKKVLIGLEIHITLRSQKKIFNWEETYQGDVPPNSQAGPWELGYLGVLPILNPEVIYLGLKLATALEMKISPFILFDRKIYNYFDLPKGYQITQYELPFATAGYLPVIQENQLQKIPIQSLQLEEDTAKSIYSSEGVKLDFNRAGNPLLELVTEPVFTQVKEVLIFAKQLQNLLRYLDISEAKMEKGQFRIDLNFSLPWGENYSTPRYEIKNLNSLANLEKALQHETKKHQVWFLEAKAPPPSQTFGFDEAKKITTPHREKTEYFYLPEANLPSIKLKKKEINQIKNQLPKLPWIYWKEIEKRDISTANLLLQNPILLKIFNFLEKKKKLELDDSKNWATFYLNYLSPHLEKNLSPFTKKWKSYISLFQYWKEKKLGNEAIKETINSLKNTPQSFNSLVKKYEKKTTINQELLEQKLLSLWDEECEKGFKLNPQKVQNYLLGQVKKSFPEYPFQEIILIIRNFLEKKSLP